MTIEYLQRFVLPAAWAVLPPVMGSGNASAMLLAIALQESKGAARRQFRGPARGFWQFEKGGGVVGVRKHPATKGPLEAALLALAYPSTMTAAEALVAIEHNDVLAAVFARLLLWAHPSLLPGPSFADLGWTIYRESWRPGKPHPAEWPANYARAWALVDRV